MKFLSKLHIYGGLISSLFFLVVGLSALNFQHQFLPEKDTKTATYTKMISFDASLQADSLSKFIRSELGISGHLPKWEFRQNKSGMFRFLILRPGRTFEVKLNRNDDQVEVTEIFHSTGKVLRAMHFGSSRNKLGYTLLDIWSFYGQLATIVGFLTLISSIFFWMNRSVKNKKQWGAILVIGIFSVSLILYIWLIG
ncbi:MAG: hypothetical protein PHV35_02050 [Mariniphaga sp.]|nr:hypothetical protein [Mariniphaga sp.]